MVVRDIAQGIGGQHATIIEEIRASVDGFNYHHFIYESTNSGVEVDSLAKYSLNLATGRHVGLLQPHDTIPIPWTIIIQ